MGRAFGRRCFAKTAANLDADVGAFDEPGCRRWTDGCGPTRERRPASTRRPTRPKEWLVDMHRGDRQRTWGVRIVKPATTNRSAKDRHRSALPRPPNVDNFWQKPNACDSDATQGCVGDESVGGWRRSPDADPTGMPLGMPRHHRGARSNATGRCAGWICLARGSNLQPAIATSYVSNPPRTERKSFPPTSLGTLVGSFLTRPVSRTPD